MSANPFVILRHLFWMGVIENKEGVFYLFAGGDGSLAAVLHEFFEIVNGVKPEQVAGQVIERLGRLAFGDGFAKGFQQGDEARRDPVEGDAILLQAAILNTIQDTEQHGGLVQAIFSLHGSHQLAEVLHSSITIREKDNSFLVRG